MRVQANSASSQNVAGQMNSYQVLSVD